MAKHSTIYPSSEDLEAVQSLVSTVECALKHVSDWMDQSQASQSNPTQSSSTQEEETEATVDESPEGSTKWVLPVHAGKGDAFLLELLETIWTYNKLAGKLCWYVLLIGWLVDYEYAGG